MKLPVGFLDKMKELLGDDEYQSFLKSYDEPRNFGLRVNTLKISVEDFIAISPFKLESIPWTKDGFYYFEDENPGKHSFYNAGLYYIQEPSAMLPAVVIDAKPGEYILDLCAAPGGKTVQIAAGMKGKGLIVANDINADRTKALVKNLELYGVRNAVVTNELPSRLAVKFEDFFDKILVDAPCSGEGMLRKDDSAAQNLEKFKNEKCEAMQWDILEQVDKMLKGGGCIVYSTCTFSPLEDEKIISRFLKKHENYELLQIERTAGIEGGRPEWSDGNINLAKTARLWPHRVKGEGHFVALLRKNEKKENINDSMNVAYRNGIINNDIIASFKKFEKENLNTCIDGYFNVNGSNLYNLPVPFPDLNGLKIAKFGWYLGGIVNGRYEPSHSLLTALNKKDIKKTIDFSASARETSSYLKGETVLAEGNLGLTAVCVDGYTLGWAKQTDDILKNLYPKGWRKLR